jgi:hypothetical protein
MPDIDIPAMECSCLEVIEAMVMVAEKQMKEMNAPPGS